MNEEKVSAIVLGSRDYKEKDKLVDLFTLESGLRTVVLKGVKNNNAKLKFAKEPFCFGEFVLSGIGDIKTVTQASVVDSFFDITQDYDRFDTGCKILKLISKVVQKRQSDANLFVISLKVLRELAYSKINDKMLLCAYVCKMLADMGYKINVNSCASCGAKFVGDIFINLDTTEIVCANCRGYLGVKISKAVQNAFKILSDVEFEKMNTITIESSVMFEVQKVLQLILQNRFDSRISIL